MCWIGGMCWGRWGGGVGSDGVWDTLGLDVACGDWEWFEMAWTRWMMCVCWDIRASYFVRQSLNTVPWDD